MVKSESRLRILGVFAHPDDETFCAGGTFARYAAEGAEIMVVSATAGGAGQIRDARIATRRTLDKVRLAELERACEVLGIHRIQCWNYADGRLADCERHELVGEIVRTIRSFCPDVVITFGADGGYGHPDHIAISEATTEACQLAGSESAYSTQIAQGLLPHVPQRLYHACFPHSRLLLSSRLVQWLLTLETRFKGSLEFAHALMLLADESRMLNYSTDHMEVCWFPKGFFILEQGEPSSKLYLMLGGRAEVVREEADATLTVIDSVEQGHFFGEMGIARQQPRNAHVIAAEHCTCLVFSPQQPTDFEGRGDGAAHSSGSDHFSAPLDGGQPLNTENASTVIDVRDFVSQKVQALCQHRSQYPLQPDMFPLEMFRDLFGYEYFVQIMPQRSLAQSLL